MKATLEFLNQCAVIVCAGSGGVGKTTTAAALGIVAARRGRRVAVVTIDPARRLADSLGLADLDNTPQTVEPRYWRSSHGESNKESGNSSCDQGSLVVMMLDTQQTLDSLVQRHTGNAAVRQKIMSNPLYHHLSTNLPGVHEYMALEKLQELQQDERYDLVVLDTPPSRNAVDFLTAPERLVEALDGKVMHWLTRSLRSKGARLPSLLGAGISQVLGLMGKITGQGLLEQMAHLVVDLDEVLGGIRSRAQVVSGTLRDPSLQFVLIGAPNRESSDEALQLGSFLSVNRMRVGAFLMNRVHAPTNCPDARNVRDVIASQLPETSHVDRDRLARAIAGAAREASTVAENDARALTRLQDSVNARFGQATSVVWAPAISSDLQGMAALSAIATALEYFLRPRDAVDLESAQSGAPTQT